MRSYIKYSDLAYAERREIYMATRSSELVDFIQFDKETTKNGDDLFSIISDFGSFESEIDESGNILSKSILITNKFVFLSEEYNNFVRKIKVYTQEEYNVSEYVTISKLEYDRLLQIEKFYNLINNDN